MYMVDNMDVKYVIKILVSRFVDFGTIYTNANSLILSHIIFCEV